MAHTSQVLEGFRHFGLPESALTPIGLIEIVVGLLVVVPRTSILGAILFTGYFGGAVATHVRIGESVWIGPVLLGVSVWFGLGLRDPALRPLLPIGADPPMASRDGRRSVGRARLLPWAQ